MGGLSVKKESNRKKRVLGLLLHNLHIPWGGEASFFGRGAMWGALQTANRTREQNRVPVAFNEKRQGRGGK